MATSAHPEVVRPAANLDDCGEVSRRLDAILQVLLEESECRRGEIRAHAPDSIEVNLATRGTLNQEQRQVTVQVGFDFHAEYKDQGEKVTPSVRVRARYVVLYQLKDVEGLEQRHLDAFAALQGPFNVWPFYREHLHSMSLKMGLNALILPLNFDGMRQTAAGPAAASRAGKTDSRG